MNIIFLMSVILKGVGAGLEVILQVLITRLIGVDGYGTYSTWINAADLIFWVLFSAITKCNTFYLSVPGTSIHKFKKSYYIKYVLPLLAVAAAAMVLTGNVQYCIILLITGMELWALDQSSTLIAQSHQMISLTGEYVLGRFLLVIGVLALSATGRLSLKSLLILYVLQYAVIIIIFAFWQKNKVHADRDISDEVTLKKWGSYQRADLIQSMIGQMPVLLQFIFSGAFEAGVVSIVLTVKKLINFISGPTAKVFLPEFSRLYRQGKVEEIRDSFASIMRIQMLFAGPLAVVLLGYPHVLLRILAKDLLAYTNLFMLCSVVFLITATLGPCSGVLQMTGNERWDNRFREIALLLMFVVMWLFRSDSLFVLYGLCAQAALETAGKFYYVCRWMKKSPVKLLTYLSWWVVPGVMIAATYGLHLGDSVLWMLASVMIVFGTSMVFELKQEGGLKKLLNRKR